MSHSDCDKGEVWADRFRLSCWGITQGPGVGKCLAELILDGKVSSADISKLAP